MSSLSHSYVETVSTIFSKRSPIMVSRLAQSSARCDRHNEDLQRLIGYKCPDQAINRLA